MLIGELAHVSSIKNFEMNIHWNLFPISLRYDVKWQNISEIDEGEGDDDEEDDEEGKVIFLKRYFD